MKVALSVRVGVVITFAFAALTLGSRAPTPAGAMSAGSAGVLAAGSNGISTDNFTFVNSGTISYSFKETATGQDVNFTVDESTTATWTDTETFSVATNDEIGPRTEHFTASGISTDAQSGMDGQNLNVGYQCSTNLVGLPVSQIQSDGEGYPINITDGYTGPGKIEIDVSATLPLEDIESTMQPPPYQPLAGLGCVGDTPGDNTLSQSNVVFTPPQDGYSCKVPLKKGATCSEPLTYSSTVPKTFSSDGITTTMVTTEKIDASVTANGGGCVAPRNGTSALAAFDQSASDCNLQVFLNGGGAGFQNVTEKSIEVWPGEAVTLLAAFFPPSEPDPKSPDGGFAPDRGSVDWESIARLPAVSTSGFDSAGQNGCTPKDGSTQPCAVANYTITGGAHPSSPYTVRPRSLANTTANPIRLHWLNPVRELGAPSSLTYTESVKAAFQGKTETAHFMINFGQISASLRPTCLAPKAEYDPIYHGGALYYSHFCHGTNGIEISGEIDVHGNANAENGFEELVQVAGHCKEPPNHHCSYGSVAEPLPLDSTWPYKFTNTGTNTQNLNALLTAHDSPNSTLLPGQNRVVRYFVATTYLVYKSNTDAPHSIYVPMASFTWMWHATAIRDPAGHWTVPPIQTSSSDTHPAPFYGEVFYSLVQG